jgi:citrate synthase
LAQWQEMIIDSEQKICRPRQIYKGPALPHLGKIQTAIAD